MALPIVGPTDDREITESVEAPAPFGWLIAAEWGYGPRGVNANGTPGTHVIRITGYKVF